MRGKQAPKRILIPDLKYNSQTVSRFINKIMLRGQKETSRKLVYKAFEPLNVFETALKNASPLLEVKARRIGGATYQVPMEVRPERKMALAMRWIIGAARSGKGNFSDLLAKELMDAFNNTGESIRKRETLHKMADANKAFAHYARF